MRESPAKSRKRLAKNGKLKKKNWVVWIFQRTKQYEMTTITKCQPNKSVQDIEKSKIS